jgi:hypothetical protein
MTYKTDKDLINEDLTSVYGRLLCEESELVSKLDFIQEARKKLWYSICRLNEKPLFKAPSPIDNANGITIKELKDFIKGLPEGRDDEPFEVWVGEDGISNVVKTISTLNLREDGCDIILEID